LAAAGRRKSGSESIARANGSWHEIRRRLNDYYEALAGLLELTATKYLDALLREYPRQVVRERFLESLSDINTLWPKALQLRDRLNEIQNQRLRVTGIRPVRGPGFFKSVLSDANWRQFSATINSLQRKLRECLAA